MVATDGQSLVHASCVTFGQNGVLIIGKAGSGKSSLALDLMAIGATLVADDRVRLLAEGGQLIARAPETIKGQIEARGLGILQAESRDRSVIRLVVDLDQTETERLPPRRSISIMEIETELVHNTGRGSFPSALRQYLLGGRRA